MWIGTDDGLNTYSNGRFSIYNKSTESNNHVFNVLLESQSKRLYAGTDKGIYQFSDNLIKPLEQNLLANYRVISLYEDGDSTLWIGTDGNGLLRWLNGELEVITKKDGLRDNFILSIDEDEQNNLWMSSHSGVFWIKKNDLVRFFTGKTSRIFSTWYSESEGMVSRQCMGKCQPAVFKTKNNRWLYPTIKGVSILNYNLLTDYCTIPKVCIEYIFCGEDTVSIDNKKSIPELNTETITVAFSATEFSAPEKIRFKYILEGYDENFLYLDSGVDRVATYHNLPYGDYRFHLLAANNELRWSEEATTIEFRINPPFYLSPSFLIIVITVTLSFSSVLIYQHHKRKKTQKVDKYKTSPLDSTKIEELLTKLETIMTEEKLFLNPDLTLGHLARRLKIHSNYISRIINEQFDMSYNDYINRYRVEEVKNRFSNPDFSDKTVLEIMYDTGFYSKSVFNMAFKKFTGMTPTEYRKKTN
jgi:AraC-like DNA-binding protein